MLKSFSTGVEYRTDTSTENCVWQTPFTHVHPTAAKFGYAAGAVVPHFATKKAKGEVLPFTQYERWDLAWRSDGHQTLEWWAQPCSGLYRKAVIRNDALGETFPLTEATAAACFQAIWKPDDIADILQAAAGKFYDRRWDAGTFAAELHKTIMMIVQLRQRVWRYAADIKRMSDYRNAAVRAGIKNPASWYLEWVFGWKNLIRDIEGAHKALTHTRLSEFFRGYRVKPLLLEDKTEIVRQGPWPNSEWRDILVVTKREVHIKGSVVGKFLSGTVDQSAPYMQPVITGLEVIPYSWVVDYFVNVGGAIKAALTLLQLKDVSSAYGIREVLTITKTVSKTGHGSTLRSYSATGSANLYAERRLRIPHPVPLTPVLGLPKGSQLWNLLALLLLKIRI